MSIGKIYLAYIGPVDPIMHPDSEQVWPAAQVRNKNQHSKSRVSAVRIAVARCQGCHSSW